jgi:hypothetical protein
LGWTLALLPVPADWLRARDILAPLGDAASAGRAPTSHELIDACVAAYEVDASSVAPLIAWSTE